MSVKLNELSILPHNGKLVVAKLNKRGKVDNFLDISTPIIKRVIQCLTTKRDETYIHQEIIDPETGETKHYKITCVEMTPQEIEIMNHNNKVSKIKAQRECIGLMGILLNSFARTNLRF